MWLAPDAIATWEAVGVGQRGGQRQYSDLAIETALTLRLIFHLPLRQTEGFLTSIFGMLGLDLSAPDHTTLSRRGQHLDLPLRRAPAGAGLHLIVDSTGLSIVGEGEWAAAKDGGRGRRGWKKLHLGVDRSGVKALWRCAARQHYLLQLHFYLVALRRYLRLYDSGGTAGSGSLLFVRGVRPGTSQGVLEITPSEPLLDALDCLFASPHRSVPS